MQDLLLSLKRAAAMQWLATFALTAICVALLALSFKLASELTYQMQHKPVYIVPGAAEGVYAPGLTRENVRNAARYLLGLVATISYLTAETRFQELERHVDPLAMPQFRQERDRRLKEILSQQQSRALFPDEPDQLSESGGLYQYRVRGRWEVRSGTLLMSELRHEFRMRFRVGLPDELNPYGIQIAAIDIAPVEAVSGGGHD